MTMAGVPIEEVTAKDFIMVRAALVRRLGGANEALVFARIHYRTADKPPHVDPVTNEAWWPVSRETLAEETGLSPDQVKRALLKLIQTGAIDWAEHRLGGNYDRTKSYRPILVPDERAESPNEGSPSGGIAQSERAESPNVDWANSPNVPLFQTEETLSSSSNTKSSGDRFDEFWSVYPRHEGRKPAAKKWLQAVKSTDPQTIIDGARKYAARMTAKNQPREFIKLPATWLHNDGWDDESEELELERDSWAGVPRVGDIPLGEEYLYR